MVPQSEKQFFQVGTMQAMIYVMININLQGFYITFFRLSNACSISDNLTVACCPDMESPMQESSQMVLAAKLGRLLHTCHNVDKLHNLSYSHTHADLLANLCQTDLVNLCSFALVWAVVTVGLHCCMTCSVYSFIIICDTHIKFRRTPARQCLKSPCLYGHGCHQVAAKHCHEEQS